jgi:hypothetical protein
MNQFITGDIAVDIADHSEFARGSEILAQE